VARGRCGRYRHVCPTQWRYRSRSLQATWGTGSVSRCRRQLHYDPHVDAM